MIKMILYELYILKYPLTGLVIQWGIPQDKLSKFKKSVVSIQKLYLLPMNMKSFPQDS